jgi:hypothetical protein
MKLDKFNTLQVNDKIEVKGPKGSCSFSVYTVTGLPFEGNTLIPAVDETGKAVSIYFRDVVQKRA